MLHLLVKKTTSSRIQKYLFKNAIDIQDGLEKEGAVVNYGDTNESTYKVVKDLNSSKNTIISDEKREASISAILDSSFSLLKSQGDAVIELEGFTEKNENKTVTHKEGRNDKPCEFLISSQQKQLKT